MQRNRAGSAGSPCIGLSSSHALQRGWRGCCGRRFARWRPPCGRRSAGRQPQVSRQVSGQVRGFRQRRRAWGQQPVAAQMRLRLGNPSAVASVGNRRWCALQRPGDSQGSSPAPATRQACAASAQQGLQLQGGCRGGGVLRCGGACARARSTALLALLRAWLGVRWSVQNPISTTQLLAHEEFETTGRTKRRGVCARCHSPPHAGRGICRTRGTACGGARSRPAAGPRPGSRHAV
jgi:hypothetical protein